MRLRASLAFIMLVTACAPTERAAIASPSATADATGSPPSASRPPPGSPAATRPPLSTRLSGPIQRLTAAVGFATTETGLIATSNGGSTWTARARMDGAFFSELRFVDPSHGWAIAERWAPGTICLSPTTASPCWTVMTTSDGGRSWQDRLSVPRDQLGTAPVTSLQAIDDQRAWVVVRTTACGIRGCVGELRTTRDGGATWTPQLSREGGLGPVRFSSAARGWIAAPRPGEANGGEDVLGSPDGGASWTTVYHSTTGVIAIDAASEQEAWVLTRDGGYCTASNCLRYELLHTADGGRSWSSLGDPKDQATCSGGHLRGPVFASRSLGWLAISLGAGGAEVGGGGLMRTRDGGRSWDCRTAPANVSDISAADPRRAWVRSDPGPRSAKRSTPELLATEDGGDTWQLVPIVLR
jgi:photosystem II stability/assembly factor-like uncharacterized protein